LSKQSLGQKKFFHAMSEKYTDLVEIFVNRIGILLQFFAVLAGFGR